MGGMSWFVGVLLLLFALNGFGEQTVQYHTENGDILGIVTDRNTRVFKGIPYARPPAGDLRWKSPIPLPTWDKVLNCTEFGPSCPNSNAGLIAIPNQSEDCLYLNIWIPESIYTNPTGKAYPVAFFIHGGGFILGASSSEPFAPNPEDFAITNEVIYVSINYRLGHLGYLAHRGLEKEGTISGNFGIQDQVAALKWVHENIHHFHGDPNGVTLMGHSAGAFSVCLILVIPEAKGLYSRAVIQSGLCDYPFEGLEKGFKQGERVEIELGCSNLIDDLEVIQCMRKQPVRKVLETLSHRRGILFYEGDLWFPFIDGKFIPGRPIKMISEGNFNTDVDILLGCTEDEATMFFWLGFPVYLSYNQVEEIMIQTFGVKFWNLTKQLYSNLLNSGNTIQKIGSIVLSDMWNCGTSRLAILLASKTTKNVFLYHFNQEPTWATWPFATLEVYHGVELTYIYMNTTETWSQVDRQLGKDAREVWGSFIKFGDVSSTTPSISKHWAPVKERQEVFVLGEKYFSRPREDICSHWDLGLESDGSMKMCPSMPEPYISWLLNGVLFQQLLKNFHIFALVFSFIVLICLKCCRPSKQKKQKKN